MTSAGLGACGGGGWTLVMKIDGTKVIIHNNNRFCRYLLFPKKQTNKQTNKKNR